MALLVLSLLFLSCLVGLSLSADLSRGDDLVCSLCEVTIRWVDERLTENATAVEIEKALRAGCTALFSFWSELQKAVPSPFPPASAPLTNPLVLGEPV